MQETQKTITQWAEDTFGRPADPTILAKRALLELDELIEALEANDQREIGRETADVLILLYRILSDHGLDVQTVMDEKMAINRARSWIAKGDGTGSHIKS